ncbi:MAG: hypothetical protein HYZ33_03920 [Ignavibacteriales bacterium]|nr:hypothetical protein [Ignavibacteriales bacterium]
MFGTFGIRLTNQYNPPCHLTVRSDIVHKKEMMIFRIGVRRFPTRFGFA